MAALFIVGVAIALLGTGIVVVRAGKTEDVLKSLITWSWTKKLLHWIIMSAGTMSECAFLVASVWMSINANIHWFMALLMGEDMTKNLTALSTMAYVVLPECIVGLAVITTLSHFRMMAKDNKEWIWTCLFGLPAMVFLALSLYTLHCSVTNATFEAPWWMVSGRAIAGYMYAFTGFLYSKLGEPQVKDKLAKKDANIAQLKAEMTDMQSELDAVCKEKEAAIREKTALHTTLTQTSESALQAYGDNVIEWLNSLDKTVDIDDIAAHTGINKRRLQNALERGEMQVRGTNKSRIWVPSLREYLAKNAPKVANKERDTGPMLQIVND